VHANKVRILSVISKSRFCGSQRRKAFFIYGVALKVLVRVFGFKRGGQEGKSSQAMQRSSVLRQEGISAVNEMQGCFLLPSK